MVTVEETASAPMAGVPNRKLPIFADEFRVQTKKFPVSGGTGNWLQAVESVGRLALKTIQRGRNRTKFPKIPCYFPCSQGMRG